MRLAQHVRIGHKSRHALIPQHLLSLVLEDRLLADPRHFVDSIQRISQLSSVLSKPLKRGVSLFFLISIPCLCSA